MNRNRPIHPAPQPREAKPVRRAPPDLAAMDRRIARGLREHMVALERGGWELSWPVVRGGRNGKGAELPIGSPNFFLLECAGRSLKQTSDAEGVRPTRASDLGDYGNGEQFLVAMRNPDTRVADVLLYSDGLLILYRNAISSKVTTECLAARPLEPEAQPTFVETAIEAAKTRIRHYLSRVPSPSVLRPGEDLCSRRDIARFLSEEMVYAGCGEFVLNAEVERVAKEEEIAQRVNEAGCVKQLDYLLRMIGEKKTRYIVRRCIASSSESLSPAA